MYICIDEKDGMKAAHPVVVSQRLNIEAPLGTVRAIHPHARGLHEPPSGIRTYWVKG